MKSGFAEKQFFELRFFFAHAWTASNPRKIYMWIDLGTWNIVSPNNLKKTEALQKNNFSSSENMFFPHMLGLLPIHDRKLRKRHIDKPFLMAKEHASRIWTFNLQVWSLPLSPLCYRNLAFKVFCLLILSLFPGCKGLGLAWITSAENQLFRLYKTFFS